MPGVTYPTQPTPLASRPAAGLSLACFGAPQLERSGKSLAFERRKSLALVIYLAVTRKAHTRQTLASLLWPEASESRALANLRQAVWEIRQVLGDEWIDTSQEIVRLAKPLWVDVTAFRESLAQARQPAGAPGLANQSLSFLREAVNLFQAPFLAGFSLRDAPAFDEWCFFEAEGLRRDLAGALYSLIELLASQGLAIQAVPFARRLVALDPLDEAAQRLLMTMYAQAGEYNALQRQYQECTALLQSELGVEPSPETQALFDRLRQARTQRPARATDGLSMQMTQRTRQNLASLWRSGGGLGSAPHNLPAHLTRFIGRQAEIQSLQQLLAPLQVENTAAQHRTAPNGHARLVTLVGPGGTGKTRLSVQVAYELLPAFPDGAWLVELAALTEPGLILQTVAATLGVNEEPGQSIQDTLCGEMQPRTLLLVLDNCEHLVAGCAEVAETLLRRCPNLHILASSREPLGVTGETIWPVPPLSFPPLEEARNPAQTSAPAQANLRKAASPSPETWEHYEAVQLFLERANAMLPGFAPQADEMAAIAGICARLDGIPLAIELAAARLPAMSVQQILQRLDDRFRLLTSGSRTALPRHRTLRALIDWSHDLLSPTERVLLRRLSVFHGGWTLEAAEDLLGDWILETRPDDPDPPISVFDGLARLVNKSLVIADQAAGAEMAPRASMRYRLLETIREYAHEKLVQAGEVDAVRRQHLAYYAKFAHQAESGLGSTQCAFWIRYLFAEVDNLRAALAWAVDSSLQQEVQLGLALTCDLLVFWWVHTPSQEGMAWLSNLLARYTAPPPDGLRARALVTLARLNQDHKQAILDSQAGLQMYQELQDEHGSAQALNAMGVLLCMHENVYKGMVCFAESLDIYRRLGDRRGEAASLASLAIFRIDKSDGSARKLMEQSLAILRSEGNLLDAHELLLSLADLATWNGDFAEAQAALDEAQGYFRLLGLPETEPFALHPVGRLFYHQGDYAQAHQVMHQAVSRLEERGQTFQKLWPEAFLGLIALRQDNLDEARRYLLNCLAGFHQAMSPNGVIFSLEGLGHLAAREGRFALSVTLFAWADVARLDMGDKRPPVEQTEVEESLAKARRHLSEAEMAAAIARGRKVDFAGKILTEVNWPELEKNWQED